MIAVDQFEELFTACRDEAERAAFADALVRRVASRAGARSSLIAAARRLLRPLRRATRSCARLLGANHVLVGPMRRDELRRAIELPAQRAGLQVDAGARRRAAWPTSTGEPGALPLLSTALLELWQQRDGRAAAPRAPTSAPAASQGAVARLAERVYGAARRPDERPRRPQRCSSGSPASASKGRPCAGGGRWPSSSARRRPPRSSASSPTSASSRQPGRGRGRARGAAARVAAAARLARGGRPGPAAAPAPRGRGAGEWDARTRPERAVPRRAACRRARLGAGHDPELDELERAFLDESRAAGTRSQRRLRAVLAGLAALLALAVAAGAVALDQRGSARERGDGGRRAAARVARARRGRPRPLAAARAPGRRAR